MGVALALPSCNMPLKAAERQPTKGPHTHKYSSPKIYPRPPPNKQSIHTALTLWALWYFLWCFSLHAQFASFLTRLSMSNMLIISTITRTMARIGAASRAAATGSVPCKRIHPLRRLTPPRTATRSDRSSSSCSRRRIPTIWPIAINISGSECAHGALFI